MIWNQRKHGKGNTKFRMTKLYWKILVSNHSAWSTYMHSVYLILHPFFFFFLDNFCVFLLCSDDWTHMHCPWFTFRFIRFSCPIDIHGTQQVTRSIFFSIARFPQLISLSVFDKMKGQIKIQTSISL